MATGTAGVFQNADAEPQDSQQARLLSVLRSRAGETVKYSELQDAGIEFPASVVSELRFKGVEIELRQGGVRLPAPLPVAVPADEPVPPIAPPEDAGPVRVYRPARRHMRLVAPLALVLGLAAIIGIALGALSNGDPHGSVTAHQTPRSHTTHLVTAWPKHHSAVRTTKPAPAHRHTTTTTHSAVVVPQSAPSSASPTVSTPAAPPAQVSAPSTGSSPAGVVQQFYEAAARHDYSTAWALADTNMRSQLQGYAAFANEMSSVRSISFEQAQTLGGAADTATVDVRTTSVQTDRAQSCSGYVRTVRSSSGWLLDGISINCS